MEKVSKRLIITFKKGEIIDEITVIPCRQGYVVVKDPDWLIIDKKQVIILFNSILDDFDKNRCTELTSYNVK